MPTVNPAPETHAFADPAWPSNFSTGHELHWPQSSSPTVNLLDDLAGFSPSIHTFGDFISPIEHASTTAPNAPQMVEEELTHRFHCTHPGCSSSFTRKFNLESHRLTHCGEKPFVCPKCNKKFTRKNDMKSHHRETHIRGKQFDCNTCGREFARHSNLLRHRRHPCTPRNGDLQPPQHSRKERAQIVFETPKQAEMATTTSRSDTAMSSAESSERAPIGLTKNQSAMAKSRARSSPAAESGIELEDSNSDGGYFSLVVSLFGGAKEYTHSPSKASPMRHGLFDWNNYFGSLRNLVIHAAQSICDGLEEGIDKDDKLFYDVRLTRALDLVFYYQKQDVTEWLPSIDPVDQAFGPKNVLSIFFLVLYARRKIAQDQHEAAQQLLASLENRLPDKVQFSGTLDLWPIGLAYLHLASMQFSMGRYAEARRSYDVVLKYVSGPSKTSRSVLIKVYRAQLTMAIVLGDSAHEQDLWTQRLECLDDELWAG